MVTGWPTVPRARMLNHHLSSRAERPEPHTAAAHTLRGEAANTKTSHIILCFSARNSVDGCIDFFFIMKRYCIPLCKNLRINMTVRRNFLAVERRKWGDLSLRPRWGWDANLGSPYANIHGSPVPTLILVKTLFNSWKQTGKSYLLHENMDFFKPNLKVLFLLFNS